jgi:hypothetical protein
VWDEEEVDVSRLDVDTVRSRTIITARRTIPKYVLWTNAISPANVAAAERYAESIRDQYDNVRVQVFSGKPGNCR